MSKGPQRFRDPEGHAVRKLYLWISDDEADIASSPTLAASAAGLVAFPGAAQYLPAVADPGTGNAIPVTGNASIAITTAAAETNTIAIPTFVGQLINFSCDVYAVGDRVITVAGGVTAAGATTITLSAAGQAIGIVGVQVAGALVWRVNFNDAATVA